MSEDAWLTVLGGPLNGQQFRLDPGREQLLGRGRDCTVVLADDSLCSRHHAALRHGPSGWRVSDLESRNGTYVNDARTQDTLLAHGDRIVVGETSLCFEQAPKPANGAAVPGDGESTTFLETMMARSQVDAPFARPSVGFTHEELAAAVDLTQALLAIHDPREVVRVALRSLRERTGASVVGFLWVNDSGKPCVKQTFPETPEEEAPLSATLTRAVFEERQAVWVARQKSLRSESLMRVSDALCAPLTHEGRLLGALHAYSEKGQFRQNHFDFLIQVARVTATALAAARERENSSLELRRLRGLVAETGELIGQCPAMVELRRNIAKFAAGGGFVLVRGETGTGKELVARAIHYSSARRDGPLVVVNGAAIAAELAESELFGHMKGSFTGAFNDRTGCFEQADLGTLFFDEVGDLRQDIQAKLLRVLDGHPFTLVGGSEPIQVDVRVVSATNRDLDAMVMAKEFRQDLLFRFAHYELVLPPLRERGSDILLLAEHFLQQYRRSYSRPIAGFSDQAKRKLSAYHWPGNVRQLRSVIDRAVVEAEGDTIEAGDVVIKEAAADPLSTSLIISDWEKKLIEQALQRTEGNATAATELLGISKATLFRKLKEYGLSRK